VRIGLVGGTGAEGRGLAARWRAAGHEVVIGSRDPARGDNAAAARCEVVVLCVPWAAHDDTIRELDLSGKIVIDLVVPLIPPVTRVSIPEGGAAALRAQQLAPAARVVAALHHVSAAHLLEGHAEGDVLCAGDDSAAKDTVIALCNDLGLRGLDAGGLANAVALESLTPVLIYMNKKYKKSGLGLKVTM